MRIELPRQQPSAAAQTHLGSPPDAGGHMRGRSAGEREAQHLRMELVSAAAQELRTPVASVLGLSELMLQEPLGESDRQEALRTMHSQAERLTALLDEFLQLTHTDARADQDLSVETVDLGEVVNDEVSALACRDEGCDVRLDLQGGILVRGDRRQLTRLLRVLVDHAIARTLAPRRVIVRVRADVTGQLANIEVLAARTALPKGQAVQRPDAPTPSSFQSASPNIALELALARRIAIQHGGRLQLHRVAEGCVSIALFLPGLKRLSAPTRATQLATNVHCVSADRSALPSRTRPN